MARLSRAALVVALSLASPLINSDPVAANLFTSKSSKAPDEDEDNGGTMRLLVSYNGEKARESIASQTLTLQGEGVQVQEVSNYEFTTAQEITSFGEVGVENIMEGWAQEGAMSTGYSVLEIDSSEFEAEMEALKKIPGVVAVEKDGVMYASSMQNLRGGRENTEDYAQDIQDAIKSTADKFPDGGGANNHYRGRRLAEDTPYGINMVQSADVPPSDSGNSITICVVDTGYDLGHEDLPNSADHGVDGFSPHNGQQWDVDGHGHGTHCAGTIGAIGGNNIGVTSVNPDPTKFKFYIGKGLSNGGSGSWSDIMDSIDKCVQNGAKVISMSLGGSGGGSAFNNLVKDHYNNGVLLIAAAGNGGGNDYSYPASYKTVVSVAAVNSNKIRASFSRVNDQVELSGPGVSVKSTLPKDKYASWSGTSMATPHVAGVAALIWRHFPDCTNNQIRNVLIYSSEDLGGSTGDSQWDSKYGWGLVNAKAAYELLNEKGCNAGGPRNYDRPLHEVALGGEKQLSMIPSTASPTQSPTTAQPTQSPTTAQPTYSFAPSQIPTFSPTQSPTNPIKTFSNAAYKNANQKAKALMFQMQAEEATDVIVQKIAFKPKDANKDTNVQVYLKLGSYDDFPKKGLERDDWGVPVFNGIPERIAGGLKQVTLSTAFFIPKGEVASLYLAGAKEFMFEEGDEEFDESDDAGDFKMFTGSAFKKLFEKRISAAYFVGGWTYSTITAPITSSPTHSPTTASPTTSPSSAPTQHPTTSQPSQSPTTASPTTAQPSQSPTTAQPTSSPTTSSPTSSPSSAPTQHPTTASPTSGVTQGEYTTPDLNNAGDKVKGGVTFTIKALSKDVKIKSLGIVGKAKESDLTVYYAPRSFKFFNPRDKGNWVEVYDDKVMLDPTDIFTINLEEEFTIAAGEFASVYVVKKDMFFNKATDTLHNEYAGNDDIELRVGFADKGEFKGQDKLAEFAGSIVYETY